MNKSNSVIPSVSLLADVAERPDKVADNQPAESPQEAPPQASRVAEFLLICLFTLLLSDILLTVGQLVAALWVLSGLAGLLLIRTLYASQATVLSGAVTLILGLRLTVLALEASALGSLQASVFAAVVTLAVTLSMARSVNGGGRGRVENRIKGAVIGRAFKNPVVQVLVALSALPTAYLTHSFAQLEVSSSLAVPSVIIVAVIFSVGVIEELFYRGLLQTLMVHSTGAVLGVLLAALFSVSLFLNLALWPVVLALLGLALIGGWLRWSTGSIYGTALARALFYVVLYLRVVGLV